MGEWHLAKLVTCHKRSLHGGIRGRYVRGCTLSLYLANNVNADVTLPGYQICLTGDLLKYTLFHRDPRQMQ